MRLFDRRPLVARALAVALLCGPATLAAQPGTGRSSPPAPVQEPAGPDHDERATEDAAVVRPPVVEETVDIVAPTPLAGVGVDRDKVPANVQRLTADALARPGAPALGEQLQLLAPSVHLNEATTNPFQPDLHLRGFVGSPLLGLPQGVAVYQNGIRLNEPFGDTVNWDLVPTMAIASLDVMPGSNPLFGLNALGGAIAIDTKTGASHPGHGVHLSTGAFGRHVVQGASGGAGNAWNYFVAGTAAFDDGWRDRSPSRMRQLFGDVGWSGASTTVHTSVSVGHNRLVGNGAAPVQLLDEDRSAVFTYPDETRTRATLAALRARHRRSAVWSFDALVGYRHARLDTFNGDDTDYDRCEAATLTAFLCEEEGDGALVRTPSGLPIAVPADDAVDGTNNTSATRTHGWTGTLQATAVAPVAGRANQFVTGITLDGGRSGYAADTEIARLGPDRGTTGLGLFDGDALVRLRTTMRHAGAYVADFLDLTSRLTLSASARVNHSRVVLHDLAGDDLDGRHTFVSLNPGAGATFALTGNTTLYGGVGRASRVPAPSELSCADPDDPCRLPNAFVADPPLAQVVATTWEGGLRGRRGDVRWNLSTFRTTSHDDIVFISSGPLRNTGHFENVGQTRRDGLELSAVAASAGPLRWGVAYTFLRARFGTPLTMNSPNHPLAENGELHVRPGDRLPGIPRHNLKGHVSAVVGPVGITSHVLRTSSVTLRGDEANLLAPVDGVTLAHVSGGVALTPHVRVVGRVANVFGAQYATFGLLGEADEVLGDEYDDPRFLSPGAPRTWSLGLEFGF